MKNKSLLLTFAALAGLTAMASAQPLYRQATMIRPGDPSEGRCTVSVSVQGAADVEIRGDNATLRTVAGPAPQWQRFECTGPLPYSSANLQLRAIEGNGKITLTRDSSSGNVAIVRITNPEPADPLYTFDLFWRPDRVYTSTEERTGW